MNIHTVSISPYLKHPNSLLYFCKWVSFWIKPRQIVPSEIHCVWWGLSHNAASCCSVRIRHWTTRCAPLSHCPARCAPITPQETWSWRPALPCRRRSRQRSAEGPAPSATPPHSPPPRGSWDPHSSLQPPPNPNWSDTTPSAPTAHTRASMRLRSLSVLGKHSVLFHVLMIVIMNTVVLDI